MAQTDEAIRYVFRNGMDQFHLLRKYSVTILNTGVDIFDQRLDHS